MPGDNLSDEERHKIYEEEKAKIEARLAVQKQLGKSTDIPSVLKWLIGGLMLLIVFMVIGRLVNSPSSPAAPHRPDLDAYVYFSGNALRANFEITNRNRFSNYGGPSTGADSQE